MKGIIDLYLEIPVLKICGFLYLTTEKEIPFYEIIFSSHLTKAKPRELERKIEISRVFFVTTSNTKERWDDGLFTSFEHSLQKSSNIEKFWRLSEYFLELKHNAAASILTPSFDHQSDFQKTNKKWR